MVDAEGPLFALGVLLVSLAYSAVGHGGASGYLALSTFSTMPPQVASTLALGMNLVVAGISFLAFRRARHFEARLAWPFLAGSVPLAFVGGSLRLPGKLHAYVLAATLLVAALWLIAGTRLEGRPPRPLKVPAAVGIGAAIGLVSGMVGVGGGIFLSPLVLLAGYADAKKTASLSALFILCNSAAGLAARPPASLEVFQTHGALLAIGAVGAVGGAALGAFWMPHLVLRRTLGVVLLVAVVKLVIR